MCVRYCGVASKDRLLVSALHGTAWHAAVQGHAIGDSVAGLRQLAGGRDDLLAEAAGVTAGAWMASPSTHVGHELLTAGLLILAGGGRGEPLDYVLVEHWTRVGFDRAQTGGHTTQGF